MAFPSLRQEPVLSRRIAAMPPACFSLNEFSEKSNNKFREKFSPELIRICSSICAPELPLCKVIILGDVAVGKTCLVKRFTDHTFENNYKATIGVDFQVTRFSVLSTPFHLQIWDTAGQERFKCIAQAYYRKAHVLMLVFDVTNLATLVHCKTWHAEAMSFNHDKKPLVFLVGTKIDKLDTSELSIVVRSGLEVARELNAEFWTVSAKTGQRIDSLLRRTAALSFQDLILNQDSKNGKELRIGCDINALVTTKEGKSSPIKCAGCSS